MQLRTIIKNNPHSFNNIEEYIAWFENALSQEQKINGVVDTKTPEIAKILGMIAGHQQQKLLHNPYFPEDLELRCAWLAGYYEVVLAFNTSFDTGEY